MYMYLLLQLEIELNNETIHVNRISKPKALICHGNTILYMHCILGSTNTRTPGQLLSDSRCVVLCLWSATPDC